MDAPTPPKNIYSDTLSAFDRRLDELKHIERFWYFMMSTIGRFRASQIPDTPCHRLADTEYRNAYSRWLEAQREQRAIEDQIRMYHDLNEALSKVKPDKTGTP